MAKTLQYKDKNGNLITIPFSIKGTGSNSDGPNYDEYEEFPYEFTIEDIDNADDKGFEKIDSPLFSPFWTKIMNEITGSDGKINKILIKVKTPFGYCLAEFNQRLGNACTAYISINGKIYLLGLRSQYVSLENNTITKREIASALNTKEDSFTIGNGLEMSEDRVLNVTIDTKVFKVVDNLPNNPEENKIYLVPADKTEEGNKFIEWCYINNTWEKLGEVSAEEVDLSNYYTKEEVNNKLEEVDIDLDYMTAEEAEALADEIFGEVSEGGGTTTPTPDTPSTPEPETYDLVNSHEIIEIEGHSVIAATINNHKYLIALDDAFKTKWKSATTDISTYAPYVPTSNTSGDWSFEDAKNQLMVANFSDYYNLDQICQNILVGGTDKNITTLVHEVRKITLGGYRWNVANFEVLNYLYEHYDELYADSPIIKDSATSNVWLPYANSSSNCWKISITGSKSSSIKCNRNGVNYEEYVIPVVIL